ncbi:hypothetical protein [Streptomyces brasiliensis]|uniref:hypothetical protein n=1 Tax=Streptomyces brasiliensis TaxID=1954 RepID=UPI00167120D6|nr:hypothetical protein [Streptomyces brasiliensis]
MSHTIEELVAKQHAADAAHAQVLELRETYGPPAEGQLTGTQRETYETALRAWRDLDRDLQTAVSEYARDEGRSLAEVDAELARVAGKSPENPEEAGN